MDEERLIASMKNFPNPRHVIVFLFLLGFVQVRAADVSVVACSIDVRDEASYEAVCTIDVAIDKQVPQYRDEAKKIASGYLSQGFVVRLSGSDEILRFDAPVHLDKEVDLQEGWVLVPLIARAKGSIPVHAESIEVELVGYPKVEFGLLVKLDGEPTGRPQLLRSGQKSQSIGFRDMPVGGGAPAHPENRFMLGFAKATAWMTRGNAGAFFLLAALLMVSRKGRYAMMQSALWLTGMGIGSLVYAMSGNQWDSTKLFVSLSITLIVCADNMFRGKEGIQRLVIALVSGCLLGGVGFADAEAESKIEVAGYALFLLLGTFVLTGIIWLALSPLRKDASASRSLWILTNLLIAFGAIVSLLVAH